MNPFPLIKSGIVSASSEGMGKSMTLHVTSAECMSSNAHEQEGIDL